MTQLTILVLHCQRIGYLRRTLAAARAHFDELEPEVRPTWVLFDNGSSAADQAELSRLGLDLLMLSPQNLGQGPALNRLLSLVRTPYFLLLEDDWELVNPERVRFVAESLAILEREHRIGQIKLDALHHLEFSDRRVYDGPFQAGPGAVDFFVMDPRHRWAGFCCPPAITRTSALREVGDFREEDPRRRWWAESEFCQRFAARFVTAKSPGMLLFRHIGDEPSAGWDPLPEAVQRVLVGKEANE